MSDTIRTDVNGSHLADNGKTKAALALVFAMLEVVADMGEQGAPSGPMYAAWMAQGGSLDGYMTFMGLMVENGMFTCSGHVYRITELGQRLVQRLRAA